MGTIRFVLRNDKPLKNGACPIDLIFQLSGQRRYYRTDKKLYQPCWDISKQQAICIDRKTSKKLLPNVDFDLLPTIKEVQDINTDLRLLKNDVVSIERSFQINKIEYSADMVLDKLKNNNAHQTKKAVNSNALFDFMQQYIDDHKATREAGSLAVYKSVKNHLSNYCKATGKKVTFENIDYNFFQSFQNYLIDKVGLNNTTVAKQLSTVKTFLIMPGPVV